MLCIKNGTIYNAICKEGFQADILIDDGKIKTIEKNIEVADNVQIINAEGLQVYQIGRAHV